jgi:hypothetical protein
MYSDKSKTDKCIIIDFDHTIGYFRQIIYLLNIIETVYKRKPSKEDIKYLLDCFPHIFRPKIYDIFNVILKNKNNIHLFILYTCNKHFEFINYIVSYLELKFNNSRKIFDYKLHEDSGIKSIENIKNHIFEHIKVNTIYCFIDNKKYRDMSDKNLKYIHCEKYIFNYELDDVIKRFPYMSFTKIRKSVLKKYLYKYQQSCNNKVYLPRNAYDISSVKLISLLNDFVMFDLIHF